MYAHEIEMISKILIAVDGSEQAEKAFQYACYLGERCKSRILLLYVIEEFATIGYSISKETGLDFTRNAAFWKLLSL